MQYQTSNQTLAVIGLGYVGLPLAVEFGKKRKVVGFDINAKRVTELRAGYDRTLETEPDELGQALHLSYTTDPQALASCTVFIVTVPTPIDEHHRPDLNPLLNASATIGLDGGSIYAGENGGYYNFASLSNASANPERPLRPKTIRSAPHSAATLQINCPASPTL